MDHDNDAAVLRIGELSRRAGVSEHVLRAWESRYGLLKPERSAGGYRLYSEDDQRRVRRMQAHLASGLAAAQAARAAIAEDLAEQRGAHAASSGHDVDRAHGADLVITDLVTSDQVDPALVSSDLVNAAGALASALDAMDESVAQAVLDRVLTDFTVGAVLREMLLPYLYDLGERWARGETSVAQEHFASHVVRSRLTSLARGWGDGRGPYALLACPPSEQHDLSLIAFGIVLNRCGWRIGYLGANTPIVDLRRVTAQLRPSLVVLVAALSERFSSVEAELAALSGLAPLALAGAGATADLADRVGARLLTQDPVTAAEQLAGTWR